MSEQLDLEVSEFAVLAILACQNPIVKATMLSETQLVWLLLAPCS